MGFVEKALGYFVVPFLLILMILQGIGLARRQISYVIRLFLKVNININGRTIYIFPLLALINLVEIVVLYCQLIVMHEPADAGSKAQYFERLFRTYRNFLLNVTSAVLIFQIFYIAKKYRDYSAIKDKLTEAKLIAKAK